jgi:hypothetical protein
MTQSLCRHLDQQRFRDVQEVTSCGKASLRENRTRCGLRNPHQLPGAAGGVVVVVAWGVGRGHREISGSVTGLMSRPSAGMCRLSQVGLAGCHELARTSDSADERSSFSAIDRAFRGP